MDTAWDVLLRLRAVGGRRKVEEGNDEPEQPVPIHRESGARRRQIPQSGTVGRRQREEISA